MSSSSPALMFTLAFAGHRAVDAGNGAAGAALAQAYELVVTAVRRMAATAIDAHGPQGVGETIAEAHVGLGGGTATAPALRLLAGYAPGTDRLAVATWRAGGHGRTHLVFPYLAPGTKSGVERPEKAFTDNPAHPEAGAEVSLAEADLGPEDRVSVLDGTAAEGERPPRAAHLEQSRFLVRFADVLIALWNGEPAQGAGGTADTVRLALARGIPVIWISSRDWSIRCIDPRTLWSDLSAEEFFALPATAGDLDRFMPLAAADALAHLLTGVFAPPTGGGEHAGAAHGHDVEASETQARRDYARDPLKLTTRKGHVKMWLGRRLAGRWKGFVKLMSGGVSLDAPAAGTMPERSGATLRQDGWTVLSAEAARASLLADHTGNLQRMVQVALLVLGVVAVAIATLAAVEEAWKPITVSAELVILVVVLVVWRLRDIAINHRRWSDSRRLAERLRGALATWPLGIDAADDHVQPAGSWIEWRVRGLLRLAGPPCGALDAERLLQDGRYGRDHPHGIVQGQIDYHALTERRNSRIAHRFERIEEFVFLALLVCVTAFIGLLGVVWGLDEVVEAHLLHVDHHVLEGLHHFKTLAGRVLIVLSAVFPMIAAACLAIEAKVGFHENALRSQKLKPAFQRIKATMAEPLSPVQAQMGLKDAARLVNADAESWREGVARRRLAKL